MNEIGLTYDEAKAIVRVNARRPAGDIVEALAWTNIVDSANARIAAFENAAQMNPASMALPCAENHPDDESHQHAILTPIQIGELVTEARSMVQAIDDDADNPVAAPFLDRLAEPFSTDDGLSEMCEVQQNTIDTLIEKLDQFALALVQVTDKEKTGP